MASPVRIDSQPAPALSEFLADNHYSSIAVLVDDHTERDCYPLLEEILPRHKVIRVPAGEEHKNLATCTFIWQKLTDINLDRHALLIILGGGVLGDMGGFCAATYKRGIDFIILPTTLLAQVDASVGGKLGIDFQDLKNHIGLFQEPRTTLIATDFLKTLPPRELRSGFAEIIKHCLISDKTMWNIIREKDLDQQDWLKLVEHSVAFKRSVVEQDPRESGLRKVLNFGHTLGHAIEGYYLKTGNRLFHGEAVAVGMICESFLARKKGMISLQDLDEITDYLKAGYGKVELPRDLKPILTLVNQDKKNRDNRILMALPAGIGKACWDVEISEDEIKNAFAYYNSL